MTQRRWRGVATLAVVLGIFAASKPLPIVDWETTPAHVLSSSDGAYTPYLNPFFTSRKTLAETTNWLASTIQRYGDLPSRRPGDDGHWTGNVRFSGCTMEWVDRRIEERGTYIEEHAYTMKLADFDGKEGSVQVNGMITANLASRTAVRWTSRFYNVEGGRRTLKTETDARADSSLYMYLQPTEDIPRRVAQALVHAGRLCGAPPPH